MEILEDLMFHMPYRKAEHDRILSIDVDTFIRNMGRKTNYGTTSYKFVPYEEVLKKLPFFWFTDIKIELVSKRTKKRKQVIYEVEEDCLRTKAFLQTRPDQPERIVASHFRQKIPIDRSRFPDRAYSIEGIQELQQGYGNPFQSFADSGPTPLESGVQMIIKKRYSVFGIDAYFVHYERSSADALLRLHWNLEDKRFLRIEGKHKGLLEFYDYGAREYLDRVFIIAIGNPHKKSFDDMLREAEERKK